jgi:hypothetical protein
MNDFMKPIIQLWQTQMRLEQENEIMRAVQSVGVSVDKERLLQALSDARAFWREGYNAAEKHKPDCTGCRWRGVRPQRCSCCRRNIHMKDNYEV